MIVSGTYGQTCKKQLNTSFIFEKLKEKYIKNAAIVYLHGSGV